MKVCIIGAGASGIAACKVMKENKIDFDCYEKGSDIGGLWWYGNDNGQNSVYKSLCINTSKQMMAYSDFPMPDDYPDYPHHSLIHQYFKDYAAHFGFEKDIHFKTTATQVEKKGDKYLVTTDKTGTKEYDAVLVCNGHHWKPKYASFDGTFDGKVLHAHDYKTVDGFEDKSVLVIGIGNSAVDIACELCTVAKKVVISTRSGAYIIPKYLFGIPTDHISKPPLAYAPLFLQRAALQTALQINVGKQENYGVPTPNRPILSEHPTISQDLLNKVGHGKVKIRPNVKMLNGNAVIFDDGTEETFDVLIYCTGYSITFPFFDKNFLDPKDNNVQLYHKVVHPEHKNLFFLGLIQPLGAIMPLSEMQAKWIAGILSGKSKLPSKEKMHQTIKEDRAEMKKRYKDSERHTVQVDFYPYKRLLEQAMKY
ncbi:MAG: NAD(P)-binding domain-containing protein [Sphingobacteriales bacterium]|nr:NAD(P)-binding domain-containing protein [Sphingobacteriales bacterium]